EAEMTRRGWTVSREPIPGGIDGYTTTDGSRRIVVDANLSDADAAATMLHEAAHAILHAEPQPSDPSAADEHTTVPVAAEAGPDDEQSRDRPADGMHRGQKEIEAESVA